MEIVLLLLKQCCVMFVYLFIGLFLFKKKLMGKAGSADIGRLLLYIVMPVAILKSYIRDFSMELLEGLVVSFLVAVGALVLSTFAARFLFRKEESVERFGAAYSNAGFIGIPLVQMTLGSEAVFYVASFVAILNVLQWTYGVWTMTGDGSTIKPKNLAKNPIILSFVAGILLFFLPITLPEAATDIISTIASMNGPLAMIVLGVYLGQVKLGELFTEGIVYKCALVRLILIPALTILLMMLVPAQYQTIKLTILIAASAPVGSNVAIFAQLYNQEYTRAVKEVCLSTLLCIVTLPLMVGIANALL